MKNVILCSLLALLMLLLLLVACSTNESSEQLSMSDETILSVESVENKTNFANSAQIETGAVDSTVENPADQTKKYDYEYQAELTPHEGQCGETLFYRLYSDGHFAVFGEGEMWDFDNDSNKAPWQYILRYIKEVDIVPGVTSIGDYAFFSCDNIVKTTFPDSLVKIGNHSFEKCQGIRGVLSLPQGVISIGEYAFSECKGLSGNLILPDSIDTIGKSAFEWCGFNGSLVIPSTIEVISEYTFYHCNFRGSLIIPDNVRIIKEGAFSFCESISGALTIPDNVTEIGEGAFEGCVGLNQELYLSKNLHIIPDRAFSSCSNLKGTLNLNESIEFIGNQAFDYCQGLTGDIIIPENTKSIGDSAFSKCTGFDGVLQLPPGLEKIGENAFYKCENLHGDLLIPDTVISIGKKSFQSCNGFDGRLHLSINLTVIPYGAFESCSGLSGELILPDGLKEIKERAFYDCLSFSGGLIIPESVKRIEYLAFSILGENKIKAILFCGDKIAEEEILRNRYSRDGFTIYYLESKKGWDNDTHKWWEYKITPWDETSLDFEKTDNGFISLALDGQEPITSVEVLDLEEIIFTKNGNVSGEGKCGDNLYWRFYEDGTLEISGKGEIYFYSFEGRPWWKYTNELTHLILNEGITKIGDSAFASCRKLEGPVQFPDSLIEIGSYAFGDCWKLSGDLIIPDNVEVIGDRAFWSCQGLDGYIRLGKNLKKIEWSAFEKDHNIKGVLDLYEGLQEIGKNAFKGCSSLIGNLSIPDSVTSIGEEAFSGCGFDGSLMIGNGVEIINERTFFGCEFKGEIRLGEHIKEIGKEAFLDCWHLKGDLIIPDSVEYIGKEAFVGCNSLSSVRFGNKLKTIDDSAFEGNTGIKGDLIIPDSVEVIGTKCFHNCSNLDGKLVIGNGVIKVGWSSFTQCGFKGELILGNKVEEIGGNAFTSVPFKGDLRIPDNVISIGEHAFSSCDHFTGKLIIGKSVNKIGKYAFNTDSFSEAYFYGDAPTEMSKESVFTYESSEYKFTLYHLDGTNGWTNPWHQYPTKVFKDINSIESNNDEIKNNEIAAISGEIIGNAIGWDGTANTGAKAAFDGDPKTYFDPLGVGDGYCGIHTDAPYILSKVEIISRDGWLGRLDGAVVQGSNDEVNWLTLCSFSGSGSNSIPITSELFENNTGFTYFRYYNSKKHGDVAEVKFYGYVYSQNGINSLISGTIIGNSYGWDGTTSTGAQAAFDGDPSTYFDPLGVGDGYCGIMTNVPYILSKVEVVSRAGWLDRLDGAEIQGSNDGEIWVSLCQFKGRGSNDEPITEDTFTNNTGYKMFRYYNEKNHGDVAEVAFYGYAK